MKHHQSPWITISLSGLCAKLDTDVFMTLHDVCFQYRFYNPQPKSVMCLKKAPINTTVPQDGHRDTNVLPHREVRTGENSPASETWEWLQALDSSARLILCCSPWSLKTLDIPRLLISRERLNNQPLSQLPEDKTDRRPFLLANILRQRSTGC